MSARLKTSAARPRTGAASGRGSLSREAILRTAIALAEAEGIEALTMRRLGQELGVQAMSLYNHVANKADLLDGVTGTLLADLVIPDVTDMSWEDGVRASAHGFRGLAHAYPNLFPLVFERPLSGPEALPPFEEGLAILRRGGFAAEHAVAALHAIVAYVGGFALGEISEFGRGRPRSPHVSYDDLAADDLAAFPHVAELLPMFTNFPRDEAFAFGLEALIVGFRARLPAPAGAARARTT